MAEPTTTLELRAGDAELAAGMFARMAVDLTTVLDHALEIGAVEAAREPRRPIGAGGIHVSFKLRFERAESAGHGCLLVPLAEAVALAGHLLLLPEEEIVRRRERSTLDAELKEALLEIGGFVANAADAACQSLALDGLAVKPDGCQGVRAGVRPALDYVEGDPLLVGRAQAKLHVWPDFASLLVVPASALEPV